MASRAGQVLLEVHVSFHHQLECLTIHNCGSNSTRTHPRPVYSALVLDRTLESTDDLCRIRLNEAAARGASPK